MSADIKAKVMTQGEPSYSAPGAKTMKNGRHFKSTSLLVLLDVDVFEPFFPNELRVKSMFDITFQEIIDSLKCLKLIMISNIFEVGKNILYLYFKLSMSRSLVELA